MLDMNIKLNLTQEEIKTVLEKCSVFVDGEITVDSIVDTIANSDSPGHELKTLMKEAFTLSYDTNSVEYEKIRREITKSMLSENLDYIKSSFFIDGIGFGGTPLYTETETTYTEEIFDTEYEEENDNEIIDETIDIETDTDEYDTEETYDDVSEEIPEIIPEIIPHENTTSFDVRKVPVNYGEAQEYINNISGMIYDESNNNMIEIDGSMNNIICRNTGINVIDNIFLRISLNNGDDICEGFLIVVNYINEAVILGRFVHSLNDRHLYYIEASANNINFDKINNEYQHYKVVFANKTMSEFYSAEIDLKMDMLHNTDLPVCIDFGTSNTTAGIFRDNKIHVVKFIDTTTNKRNVSTLCPTIVYVNHIGSVDPYTNEAYDIEYIFGYDAKKALIDSDYDPKGSIFFEIKRWITSTEEKEEISDGFRTGVVKRKDIIKAYLEFILQTANNYFKLNFTTLHFSAPVKMKNKFISFIKRDVFTERDNFHVYSPEDSLDEGMAIVYSYISEKIEQDDMKGSSGEKKGESIITIDCGGSTTDIVSCKYSYQKTPSSYNLELETRFEKGNSNFGGNNITYRIFQFLKIKLADYYRDGTPEECLYPDILNLINANQNDILNKIDYVIEHNNNINNKAVFDIYDCLDINSKKSEEILPTDFRGNSKYANNRKSSRQTKRNFYYLWQLAEKIKVEFFAQNNNISHSFSSPDDNNKIHVDTNNLYFYIRNPEENGSLLKATREIEKFRNLPDIEVNTKEITALLRPDIYFLLSSIFSFDQNKYDYIKLSGQSCKINLFQDLLKEFIPGKKLRLTDYAISIEQSNKLKMDCLYGCIAYLRDRLYNRTATSNIEVSQNIIYDVVIARGGEYFDRHNLITGADYLNPRYRTALPSIYIDQYNAYGGCTTISVYNTIGTGKLEGSFSLPINCSLEEATEIIITEDEYAISPYVNLKSELLRHGYSNIGNYSLLDEDMNVTNTSVINDLLYNLRAIEVRENEKKVLVFAIPNKDGYGYLLYQILKVNDGFETHYYKTFDKMIPFESSSLDKSFFDGRNCNDIIIPEDTNVKKI
ncbi:MAG: hypothetical protein K2J36_06420 [Ruminococcus sp.]|nr:hypothetical protein [Ruminococcus sp.]MDE6797628.1 hypothetical protein [Ruminococcus sp.]